MEESKPRVRRSATGARPARPAGGASASSHVIDLRAAAATQSAAPKPKPVAKPVSKPAPRRPLAAPNQSKVAPPVSQPVAPVAQPPAPLGPEPSLSPRRFWPAFWRFLVLLIVLAALVSGGFYLYINYFRG